jgi:hypothetical protein
MFDSKIKFPLDCTPFHKFVLVVKLSSHWSIPHSVFFNIQVNFSLDCINCCQIHFNYSAMILMKKEETSKSLNITLMPEYSSSNQILFPVVRTSLFLDYESVYSTYFEKICYRLCFHENKSTIHFKFVKTVIKIFQNLW